MSFGGIDAAKKECSKLLEVDPLTKVETRQLKIDTAVGRVGNALEEIARIVTYELVKAAQMRGYNSKPMVDLCAIKSSQEDFDISVFKAFKSQQIEDKVQ
jgi:hypothetical protein